jgi:hypothetical protein
MPFFVYRLEEAAPMLNGDTTVVKQKIVTSQTPTNKNGFVSTDELQPGRKRTLQGLVPQVIQQFRCRFQKCRSQLLRC